ncbi:MAG: DUF3455 domain-containing protein [Betaproteobacteria bacterium]|nr:DUF3455 domain-containing protein [Betaproteobacteria bacterium]
MAPRVTGKQVAVSTSRCRQPAATIGQGQPDQRPGKVVSMTYIQRLNTVGGAAPAQTCDMSKPQREIEGCLPG